MKRNAVLILSVVVLFSSLSAYAQQDKSKRKSLPAVAEGTIDGIKVKVDYSQPEAKGRKIMGGLVPYGEVWRTGANENTIIEFDKNVKIEGQALPAGKYSLFTIPNENEWTVIFNKVTDQWGHYDYEKNKGQNALEVKVKPAKAEFTEKFVIGVDKDAVNLKWENTSVSFKVAKG